MIYVLLVPLYLWTAVCVAYVVAMICFPPCFAVYTIYRGLRYSDWGALRYGP